MKERKLKAKEKIKYINAILNEIFRKDFDEISGEQKTTLGLSLIVRKRREEFSNNVFKQLTEVVKDESLH